MITKILVTGCKGQLGNELQLISPHYPYSFTFVDKEECDLTDKQAVAAMIDTLRPDAIINCAAYTAVDDAESHADMAEVLNAKTVQWLAERAKQINALLIHISTDYVFDGTKATPYNETDETNPISVYGKTKLLGELAVKELQPRAVIIRTAWLYSSFGKNFVKTIMRLTAERDSLNVVCDQIGTPTYAADLAKAIMHILAQADSINGVELFNYSNEGKISWYDFAKRIAELAGNICTINPVPTTAYPTPAHRPQYSLLDKTKIKQRFQLQIPQWDESLQQCMALLK